MEKHDFLSQHFQDGTLVLVFDHQHVPRKSLSERLCIPSIISKGKSYMNHEIKIHCNKPDTMWRKKFKLELHEQNIQ
jgi:hypothetical protein